MSNKYDITAVYTQPDKKTGRGQVLAACPVKRLAVENGLKVIQPQTLKDPAEITFFQELKPDLAVIAAYGRILPDPFLEVPTYKCINIHPSLLPQYRGPSPIAAAILNGDTVTGVSIMLIEKKVDSGPVLSQREMAISDDDTKASLSGKLALLGAELLVETLPLWAEGKIHPKAQDEEQASYTRMEAKEDGKLDFHLTATKLWRMVRAYYPWPGCYLVWKNMRLGVVEAVPLPGEAQGKVGQAIEMPRSQPARLAVQTADGLLGLKTVQPEGKRRMAAAEFIAGHRDFVGSLL